MSDLLQVKNLTIDFGVHEGTLRAVDHVSFAIPPGGTLALVGESGSGKSVCSQAIMGLLPRNATIASGEILFNDPRDSTGTVDIAKLDRSGPQMRAIRGGEISIIFQEPMTSLSALHTVGDQIGEAVELHGGSSSNGLLSNIHSLGDQLREAAEHSPRKLSRGQIDQLTLDMLRMVGFPDPRRALRTYPFELSGGLRQRAMIAMALVCRPALLIADEPTTALDVTIQAQILRLMKDLQKELGMALLMITHDLGVVANVADDVVVMYRGKVVESGNLKDLFRDPQHPYFEALLHAVPRFDMAPGERLEPIREIKAATGHLLKEKAEVEPLPSFNPHAPVLKVRHLSKTYKIRKADTLLEQLVGGGTTRVVRAVHDVSFDVVRGECLGLVGESGCGKTTLSKMLMRGISADASNDRGAIVFDDWGRKIDVLSLEGKDLAGFRQKLQFIFQDPFGSLNPRMTVYDILVEPLLIHGIGDDAYRREMVGELMELVGLDRRQLSRYPHSFSGGQRQRIGIARSLALRPDMVICDEPVSALDVSIQAQILNLLKDLQQQLGLTLMFISHNLAVVDYIADRIAVMCAGRLVELAPAGELFKNPLHPYTQALVSAVPVPDPGKRLDLRALMEGKASDPREWPAPYTDGGERQTYWTEVSPDHYVRIMRDDG
jgi:peptide/nickel transport system ATP-binding protein